MCNAHHLRELAGICDADPDQGWAQQMLRLLCEINDTTRYARHAGADALDKRLLAVYRSRYESIIAAGKAANPTPTGARSRSPAARLLARLGGLAADVLRFAYDLRVPFDNSQAERDIRMVKLRQKINGGLRTMTGAQIQCLPGCGWMFNGPNSSTQKITSGSPSSGITSASAIAYRCSSRAFFTW